MSDTSNAKCQVEKTIGPGQATPCCGQTPLPELLRGVPIQHRLIVPLPEPAMGDRLIPVGRYCHMAADEIENLRLELKAMTIERTAYRDSRDQWRQKYLDVTHLIRRLYILGQGNEEYGSAVPQTNWGADKFLPGPGYHRDPVTGAPVLNQPVADCACSVKSPTRADRPS